jgi:hypothetical protein
VKSESEAKDRLRSFLLGFMALTMIILWLPLVRGLMDGDSYSWAGYYFGLRMQGSGIGGDYWKLVLVAAVAVAGLWYGWRGGRQPFHWVMPAWLLPIGGGALYVAFTEPEELRLRGDTLGMDISLVPVAWLIAAIALAAVYWAVRDLRSGRKRAAPKWTAANSILFGVALAMVPFQFYLLHFGPPHDSTDAAGVVLTIGQWLLVNVALARGGRGTANEAQAAAANQS